MTSRQQQKSGDNSLNMQVANLNTGMSYSDVRDIARDAALDTFKANFPKLRDEAAAVVLARVEEITDKFFAELVAAYPEAISNARDPDMQMALLQVQKEYARTGDKDMGDVLVDILVDRSSQTGRSLRQLLLGEALNTVPQLTVPCMATLSTLWLISSVVLEGTDSVGGLHNALRRLLIPCAADLATKNIELRHLEYAGCVSIGIGES